MPFDPTKPVPNTLADANEMRAQFLGLKELIDAQPLVRATATDIDCTQLGAAKLLYTVPDAKCAAIDHILVRGRNIITPVTGATVKLATPKGDVNVPVSVALLTGFSMLASLPSPFTPVLEAGDTLSVQVVGAGGGSAFTISLDIFLALVGENE